MPKKTQKKISSFNPIYVCKKCGNITDFVVSASGKYRARLEFFSCKSFAGRTAIASIVDQKIDGLPFRCKKVMCSNCGEDVYAGKTIPKLKIVTSPKSQISEIEDKADYCIECGKRKEDALLEEFSEKK